MAKEATPFEKWRDTPGHERWPTLIYEEWMKAQGIPVYEALLGVEDMTALPRKPWARMGGKGTFVQTECTKEAGQGLYVVEIPPGGALEPEKHMYDELIFTWQGRGMAEVWQGKGSKRSFEWGPGSLFAIPLNASHRLVNGGREPAIVFGKTSAPAVMNTIRDTDFLFNCNYDFTDRYAGETDYFLPSEKRYKRGLRTYWQTNFIPDVNAAFLDDCPEKAGPDGTLTFFELAAYGQAHASEWQAGRYHKAHHHGAGPILVGLKSEGYVLAWPVEYGIHPYRDGHADKVVMQASKAGRTYAPYGRSMFHQHFNTGPGPARQLNYGGGGHGFSVQSKRGRMADSFAVSVRKGGTVIEYEDEDPEIRRIFEAELKKKGIKCDMPPFAYNKDGYKFTWPG